MRADVVLVRCANLPGLFGMRIEERNPKAWFMTWAFRMDESRATREGYTLSKIQGSLEIADGWPGCPYCENQSVVRCGQCGKVTCLADNSPTFACAWCGDKAAIEGSIDSFETGGDG